MEWGRLIERIMKLAVSVCVLCIDTMNDFHLMISMAQRNTFLNHHLGLSFRDSHVVFLIERWLGKQFCYATLECCKIWEKAFKKRPSKIFIGCLSQILISPFLNTLPHMFLETLNQFSANLPFNCSIYFDIWRKALKGVKFNGNIAVKCGFWTILMGTLQWNVVFEPFQWEQWSEMWFLNHFKECEKMLCLFF